MKTRAAVLVLLIFCTLGPAGAVAGQRELVGAPIGAGSGALIGHAAGGSRAPVLVGSAIGGVLGVSVASRAHERGYYFVGPSWPLSGRTGKYLHRDSRYHRHFGPRVRHYRSRDCKIVTYQTYRHGHRYLIKKRICRTNHDFGQRRFDHDRNGWHRGHNYGGYGGGNSW